LIFQKPNVGTKNQKILTQKITPLTPNFFDIIVEKNY